MDAATVNKIADAIIARRVNTAVENRVNARGGTAKDVTAVKKAIAQKLA